MILFIPVPASGKYFPSTLSLFECQSSKILTHLGSQHRWSPAFGWLGTLPRPSRATALEVVVETGLFEDVDIAVSDF